MNKFVIIHSDTYTSSNERIIIRRTIEAMEVKPAPGSNGGVILRNRTTITQKPSFLRSLFGFAPIIKSEDTVVYCDNLTISQIKS